MTILHEWLFKRRHKRACALARDLAMIGVEKRRQSVHERAIQIRRELGLPPSPALKTGR